MQVKSNYNISDASNHIQLYFYSILDIRVPLQRQSPVNWVIWTFPRGLQGRRRAGALPALGFQKGGNGGGGALSQQCHRSFHGLSRSTWNKFIADIRAPTKFKMVFYNLCYYFWGQRCFWTETNILLTIFLYFYKFPLPATLLLPPTPALPLLRRSWSLASHLPPETLSSNSIRKTCSLLG